MIMIKKVLIDLDGTLLDFNKGEKASFIETINKFTGYVPNDLDCQKFSIINEYYFQEYSKGNMERKVFHFNRFKEIYEYLELEADILASNEYYINSLKYQAYIYDDVIDALKYLYDKYELYIASNGMTSVQIKRLEKANIDKYFKKVYVSELIQYNKPDERFFNYIFNDLNDYEKKNYVIIGDRLDSDILGGKISGIKAIYLNRDNTKGDIKPDYEIKSFKEITVIL